MKKLFALTCCALAVVSCKTEIEKDVSLNKLLTQPIQTETALLNVEIFSCNNREDSRLESDDLIKIKQKIPSLFKEATFKECYSKRAHSFAVFEIPVGFGKVEENTNVEHDIAIYSYKNRALNVRTRKEFSDNIRNYLKREFIPSFEFSIVLNVKNDTDKNQDFNIYSAYINDSPFSVSPVTIKKGDTWKIKLANASADMLWKYDSDIRTLVLGPQVEID